MQAAVLKVPIPQGQITQRSKREINICPLPQCNVTQLPSVTCHSINKLQLHST